MIEVYLYVPVDEVDNIAECGLKLSKWWSKSVTINGESRKYISALLNPRDNRSIRRGSRTRCIRLELPEERCWIGDSWLYELSTEWDRAAQLYIDSIVPAEKYVLGSYRMPECLIESTVMPESIKVVDKRLDSPVLYSSSEALYVNNIIEICKDRSENFSEALLYCFCSKLADEGRLIKIEDAAKGIAVFFKDNGEKRYIVKIPDLGMYLL
ncbi:hypothetical protein DFR58_12638 [Anaerobacterium chartisolvens]|uniref:Uncharacterized protein n=1 Tax=Anaerobacterium chartisolvens TaxID=1297424 RepID=A0A369AQ73_9FIRM|nr:hypothetical protein [Anaerobacterium chartisolvens]RCX11265.1 hypothetical protein DFR58_12638 [Anaerobacterium chartisolvens]